MKRSTTVDPTVPILQNRDFLLLWTAQFLTQTAQQAIWFGMIIVVEQVSQSSIHLSVAMLSTIVPGVLLGLLAGVVVDRSNKKTVLIVTNFLRAAVVLGYLLYPKSLYVVYVVNFLFVGISQFFGPAEASTIPALVRKRDLVAANSLFNLTFTISQLVGIVLLAPWVIKFFGASTLFVLTSAIYVVAGFLVSLLPAGVKPERTLASLGRSDIFATIRHELGEAWSFITVDRRTWWAMVFVTMAQTVMLVLAMLAPRYVVVEVGIQPEDAVYMFAPAGLGIFVMTLSMTRLAHRYGEIKLAYVGGLALALALTGMGFLPAAAHSLAFLAVGSVGQSLFGGERALIPPLMAISALIGVGFALANIPTQAVLMERAPVQTRGRIFSALLVLQNVAALAPLAFLGALADLFGVARIVGVVGGIVAVITLVAYRDRDEVRTSPRPETVGGSEAPIQARH